MKLSQLEKEIMAECWHIERQLTTDTVLKKVGMIPTGSSELRDPISEYMKSMLELVSKFGNKYCTEKVEEAIEKFSNFYNYC
jgi:hypothetical protein